MLQNLHLTRLNATQINALEQILAPLDYEVCLFGSRTNIAAKGGDIDLLIIADILPEAAFELSLHTTVKYQMISDEKIDILVLPPPPKMTPQQANFFHFINKICLKNPS